MSRKTSSLLFSLYCMTAGFLTYCSMYAFRKPFTAATFVGLQLWGVDYKIILIISQVIGYALSKFMGIKVVSEMRPAGRVTAILGLIGLSWTALLLFAVTPSRLGFIWLFINGLPLGMIWGLVFSFLEGRRNTELSGAAMSASFILSSGLVKAVGKYLLEAYKVSEFWMPFLTGLIFVPLLLLGVWMLSRLPAPDADDVASRTVRIPMTGPDRRRFFITFAPGIVLVVLIYMALTIFRDIRDNFAVEIWTTLGYEGNARVLATAEIPIAIAIMILTGLMVFMRNNRIAFYSNLFIIQFSGLLLLLTTYLFTNGYLSPALWMILFGFGTYFAYVTFHTMLFERWIAHFRQPGNIGFLLYLADAFGYLGSVGILFFRNFGSDNVSWLTFIHRITYSVGGLIILLSLVAFVYFRQKEKQLSARDIFKKTLPV